MVPPSGILVENNALGISDEDIELLRLRARAKEKEEREKQEAIAKKDPGVVERGFPSGIIEGVVDELPNFQDVKNLGQSALGFAEDFSSNYKSSKQPPGIREAGALASTVYDQVKDIPAEDMLYEGGRSALQLGLSATSKSPTGALVKGTLGGMGYDVVGESIAKGEPISEKEAGQIIGRSLISEVLPSIVPGTVEKIKKGVTDKYKSTIKEPDPKQLRYDQAVAEDGTPLLNKMDVVKETIGRTPIVRELQKAQDTLLNEDLYLGIPDQMTRPGERYKMFKKNYLDRIQQYQDLELDLLSSVDKYVDSFGEGARLSRLNIPEASPDFIRKYDLPENFIANVQGREFGFLEELGDATTANAFLMSVQQKLREKNLYLAQTKADNLIPEAEVSRILKETEELRNVANKVQNQIDEYTQRVVRKGSKFQTEGSADLAKFLQQPGFKELNNRQHDLLVFKDELAPNYDTLGRFQVRASQQMNTGNLANASSGSSDVRNVARRSFLTPAQKGVALLDLLGGTNDANRILQSSLEAPDKLVDEARYIRRARAGLEGPPEPKKADFVNERGQQIFEGLAAGEALPIEEQANPDSPSTPANLAGRVPIPDISKLFTVPEANASPRIPGLNARTSDIPQDISGMVDVKPALLPRDVDIISSNPKYIEQLRTHPSIGPDGVKLLLNAKKKGSPHLQKAVLYKMLQSAPDIFEESVTGIQSEVRAGNSFTIADPREAELYKQELGEKFERGEITDSVWLAEQFSALNSKYDMRIIPTKEQEESFRERLNAPREQTRSSNPIENLRDTAPPRLETAAGDRIDYSSAKEGRGRLGKIKGPAGDVEDALRQRGYSDSAIAGILGNIEVETGGSFDYTQQQNKGPGYGLFQFDFMKPYYKDWLEESDYDDSLDAQVEFVHRIIDGEVSMLGTNDRKTLQRVLRESNDPEYIAQVFSDVFLKPGKPHLERRVSSAGKFYNTLVG